MKNEYNSILIKVINNYDPELLLKEFGIDKEKAIELLKCKASFRYFCYKYVKIPEPGADIRLITNEAQEIFIDEFFKHRYLVINKSRQIGLSTILQALALWVTIFFKNVIVGIISRNRTEATEFVKKAKDMLRKLPKWMVPPMETDREQRIKFKIEEYGGTGGDIMSGWVNASNPGSVFRGPAVTLLIIDEAAFIPHIDEAFTAMSASTSRAQERAMSNNIPYGTIIVSTPNTVSGIGQWFYNKFSTATSYTDKYKALLLHWSLIKEYREDPEWYKSRAMEYVKPDGSIDWEKVDQEYNCVFLSGSSKSLFDPDVLRAMNFYQFKVKHMYKNFMNENGTLEVYKEFNPDNLYIISYDTATSVGKSFSTVEVLDFKTLEQVAEYQGKLHIKKFPNIIKEIIKMYPNYLLIGEYNTINETVGDTLYEDREIRRHMYREKVYSINKRTMTKELKRVYNGIMTTGRSKPELMDDFEDYVKKNFYLIKSMRLKLEISALNIERGKVTSSSTMDLVMATAFAVYLKYERLYSEIPYYEEWKNKLYKVHDNDKIKAEDLYDDIADNVNIFSNIIDNYITGIKRI